MDDEYQRFNGYGNSFGQPDTFGSYGESPQGDSGRFQYDPFDQQPVGAGPDDLWPYGPIGPGGAPLIAQQAPIYSGPYTGWGWGYGASLRGYGPGYAATGMGSGPASIGGFVPGPPVQYGPLDGQGYTLDERQAYGLPQGQEYRAQFAPGFAPGFVPGMAFGYRPAFAPGAFQPTAYAGPFAPASFAPSISGSQGYAVPTFGMPAPFAPPPFVRVLGYVVVPGSAYTPQSRGPTAAPGDASPGTPAGAGRMVQPHTAPAAGQPVSTAQQYAGGGGHQATGTSPGPQGTPAQHGPYSGVGPQNYVRSDMRIHEDIHERMTAHGHLDASGLTVSVEHGVVTLNGIVPDRAQKRMAEDISDAVPGVKDVVNHLSVQPQRFGTTQTAAGASVATQ